MLPSLQTWLIAFKYLGLSLAAGSSIWATVNQLTINTADGHKQLTLAGRVSIMLTLLGLVISIVSEDLQRRNAARTQAAQVAAEAKRTNDIIVAGQPLTSLKLMWTFQGLDASLVQRLQKGKADAIAFIEDQQGARGGTQNSAVFRENQLYPFLVALSRLFTGDTEKGGDSNVIVLFPLGDDKSAVIPFGFLESEKSLGSDWAKAISSEPSSVPSLEIDTHAGLGNSALLNWPDLETNETNATITWELDPSTFAKSLNRQNQFIVPTAKLPSVVRVAILFDIKGLPFASGNFALPFNQDFWNVQNQPDTEAENFRGKVYPTTQNFASYIQLVPNNSTLVVYNYTFNQVYETQFLDEYGEAYHDTRCIVFEYKLES